MKYEMPDGTVTVSHRDFQLAWIKLAEPFICYLDGDGVFVTVKGGKMLLEIKGKYELIPLWIADLVNEKEFTIKRLEERMKRTVDITESTQ